MSPESEIILTKLEACKSVAMATVHNNRFWINWEIQTNLTGLVIFWVHQTVRKTCRKDFNYVRAYRPPDSDFIHILVILLSNLPHFLGEIQERTFLRESILIKCLIVYQLIYLFNYVRLTASIINGTGRLQSWGSRKDPIITHWPHHAELKNPSECIQRHSTCTIWIDYE